MIPRELFGPDNTLVDAKPVYDHAIKTARPALQALYRAPLPATGWTPSPSRPRRASPLPPIPSSSSLENFGLFIQNTDPGSNAGIPGIQIPIALGATSQLPVGLELDGPAGSDRQPACDRHGA